MLGWLAGLNPELIAGGVVGLSMLGVIARNVILGWGEARSKLKESERSLGPMASALSLSWDKDQIERTIQLFESIAESLSAIAASQGILSDNFQQNTQTKLDELLERMDQAERTAPRRR